MTEGALGVTAGILTVITALLGLYSVRTTQGRDEAQVAVSDLSGEVEQLEREVAAKGVEIEDLQRQNEELIQRLDEQGGETRAPQSAPSGTPGNVRRAGPIIIDELNDYIDLDAGPSVSNWSPSSSDSIDLMLDGDFLYAPSTTRPEVGMVARGGQPVNYEQCSAIDLYEPGRVRTEDLNPGSAFCWRTGAGRLAAVTVRELRDNGDLVLDATVYKRSGE